MLAKARTHLIVVMLVTLLKNHVKIVKHVKNVLIFL